MRDLVDAQTEVDIRKRVLDQIRADLASGTEIVSPPTPAPCSRARKSCKFTAAPLLAQLDAPQRYARLVEAEMKKYKAKTSRQRYAHNKLYEKFRQKVWVSVPLPFSLSGARAHWQGTETDGCFAHACRRRRRTTLCRPWPTLSPRVSVRVVRAVQCGSLMSPRLPAKQRRAMEKAQMMRLQLVQPRSITSVP